MSVQKHTLSYPTSMNQSVNGFQPLSGWVTSLCGEEFSSNAVYPEENASNHICHPVHGTASYARHSAIPDFDFAFEDTFPQVVDWNINGQSMGESSSVMDSSVLGESYPNPSPATSLPFELIASTSRPLIALTDLSHSPTPEVSSPTSYLGWSSHISPGVGGKDHPTRSIDGSQSMTTGNTDLGPCASHCDSSLLQLTVNASVALRSIGRRKFNSIQWRNTLPARISTSYNKCYPDILPGPEPSGHASRPIGPDRIHPGNFNSPLMGCNSWYGNDPAVPHPRGSHPASAEHIQPGGNYPSMSQLAYQEFVLPMTSNCSDGGSSGSWTQSLSPDSQPVIHAGSRNMFSIPHETQNDASSGSWEVSANVLVDGVFNTSAGQHNNFQDLGPSLEEEMRLTGDSERINICEPGGRASAEHLLILQCPSSLYEQPQPQQKPQPSQPTQPSFPVPSSSPSPISSESLLSSSPTRRRGAAPGPLLPCPWGMLYGMNGEEYRCSFSESTVNNGRVLEHWARHHVANEVFAIRRKIIKMTHANIVKTQWRLETALLHLGLCPNPECDTESPMRVWYNRSKERKRHIKKHPSCEKFFGHSFGKKEKGKVGGGNNMGM
ncbi:hypothetical protein BU17DRAFT_71495 [Hysterangium stoloniferum]|nr:hypothetical protein BU17DRAFT_71495 [Hysterangium stoloniferum]